ncbi:hypothetical protein AN0624.2 [Aspergillus nidulans FGSC A4]|uniref:Potassium channel tetramerisation-type BTB domain-containing protein n=1 Tax=Emericella nidulans (strain FGSC A4 / ATCC 38163 / CBS 112.46 / NRRL 194 / M139) TaxID=227321 RepID=Q5BFQ6_EMENI|nr:hypothetical protein [Aspergillus nidulans FGSC A4]EAA65167.1 hypothetical protein AN0624.2 [Aspergillus nidulans FGSC A4]CBF89110.1 TPA: conserved hypothetical protein [Aspergillus nidulans FGSC A4]|eukprot:XP_658228.1 hypothetical protein AN0624.2 [Aspergillus nidulans FGSC A4]
MAADKTSPPVCTLPPEKVFSIQIGTKLFRLSGASIASDGYHCLPKDGAEFVKLFADAQFYSLPRLMSQLFESQIIIQIGDRHFQISRDIFSGPGDSPNFFTLGFGAFFASPAEVFPGLDRRGLLRPPAIVPPSVPNRSGDVFAQLVHLLQGYPLHVESEAQRAELLRDCRYFHLRGLEQKLIPHHITFNPLRRRSEIVIRLEDVRRSGIRIEAPSPSPGSREGGSGVSVQYARPFADDSPHDLILEIGGENTVIDLATMRPTFLNSTQARVSSLLQVILDRKNSQDRSSSSAVAVTAHSICAQIDEETDLTIDGAQQASNHQYHIPDPASAGPAPKRRRVKVEGPEAASQYEEQDGSSNGFWVVRNGQWRISIRPGASSGDEVQFAFVGVKLDVYTRERVRNRKQAFLGS